MLSIPFYFIQESKIVFLDVFNITQKMHYFKLLNLFNYFSIIVLVIIMNIDINKVYAADLVIDEKIEYEYEFYSKSAIKELEPVKVSGKISINSLDELNITLNIEGNMHLSDAVTLELVKYPFNISIEETIDNNDEYFCIENNKMDLKEFVWKNIVLEIPIRVVSDFSIEQQMEGNGWSLNKEQVETSPFDKLNELFEKDEK